MIRFDDGTLLTDDGWFIYTDGTRLRAICGGYGSEAVGAGAVAAYVGAAAAVASAAVGTYAAIQQSEQQAAVARANARNLQAMARAREEQASYEEAQFRVKGERIASAQTAAFASSGYETTSGSPLMQELETARNKEQEALNIRRGGEVVASEARFQAGLRRAQAQYASGQIPGEIAAGGVQAGTSILSQWTRRQGYA